MKKVLLAIIMVACSVVLFYGISDAAVSGVCSGCHTMHDSQGGVDQGATGTQNNLTTHSCVACHTSGGNALAPKIDGTAAADGRGSGSNMTAGGDYNLGTEDQRHNLVGGETYLAPPGYDTGAGGLDWDTGSESVSCDGAFGCHGTHGASPSVNGQHHNTAAPGYRFLFAQPGNDGGDGTPVNGIGSTTWEAGGATTANHNVYDADGTNSLSALCANCHGLFHDSGNTNASSPFQRHPTDEEAVISNIVASSFTPTNAQINETPFGFSSAEISAGMVTTDMTTGTAYTTANGEAICVSCHRAHGTDQNDLLRFDYSTMNAGDSTNDNGCETCHVAQR